jgi:Fic/DOC family
MTVKLLLASISFLASAGALACPENLKNLKTKHLDGESLCQLSDRLEKVKKELSAKGVTQFDRFSDALAPRFINGPTWEKDKVAKNFNPWMIYDPAPRTWQSWELGKKFVDQSVVENKKTQQVSPITQDWIRGVHRASLTGLYGNPGVFRTGGELGLSFWRAWAVNKNWALEMKRGGGYQRQKGNGESLFTWHATLCFEDQTPETLQYMKERQEKKIASMDLAYWPEIQGDLYFTDEKGQEKQCGYITYPPANEVELELSRWTEHINSLIQEWNKPNTKIDALTVISRAQRWFIGIHPFVDGNGRTSRFIMDLLVQSLNLPAAILKDMDHDMYLTEDQWAREIGQGLLRSIKIIENCNKDLKQAGCNIVGETP